MIFSVDWIHVLDAYVVVSILVLLCVSMRMRSAAQIRAVTWVPLPVMKGLLIGQLSGMAGIAPLTGGADMSWPQPRSSSRSAPRP